MDLVVLVVLAVVLAGGGIAVGMLMAPRVERWGNPRDPDEDAKTDEQR